ncbi:MAG: hypothetical protein KDD37_11780, partial [Bdellovibrionales bacterium]|nr:hypothetical protein [Bdellovibrionales bacterium]
MNSFSSASKALLVSISGVLIYILGNHIHIPLLSNSVYDLVRTAPILSADVYSWFGLGITSLVTGFFVIEVLSFILPPFSTWRRQSRFGRNKLNLISLILGLIIALLQSYALVSSLVIQPAVLDSVQLTKLLIYAYFLSGVLSLYYVCQYMTKFGLANGFGVIIIYDIIKFTVANTISDVSYTMDEGSRFNFTALIFLIFFIYLLYKFVLSTKRQVEVNFNNEKVMFDLSPVAQGIFCISWAYTIVSIPNLFVSSQYQISLYDPTNWFHSIGFMVLLLILSFVSYWLAYSPKRVQYNAEAKMDTNNQREYNQSSIKSLITFVVIAFLFSMPRPFEPKSFLSFQWISLAYLVFLFFISKDIVGHLCFLKKHKDVVTVETFDNIHLANLAKNYLLKNKIDCHLQGFEFRRLYSFVGSMYKIKLLVPRS